AGDPGGGDARHRACAVDRLRPAVRAAQPAGARRRDLEQPGQPRTASRRCGHPRHPGAASAGIDDGAPGAGLRRRALSRGGQLVMDEYAAGLPLRMVTPRLVKEIRGQFALDWHGEHGASHWARVYAHGQAVGAAVGADLRVCELFAFLHDARRLNENHDPEHGPRAADYAAWLRGKGYFELEDAAFALLREAGAGHSNGRLEA